VPLSIKQVPCQSRHFPKMGLDHTYRDSHTISATAAASTNQRRGMPERWRCISVADMHTGVLALGVLLPAQLSELAQILQPLCDVPAVIVLVEESMLLRRLSNS
jgi:hypothetical protein